MFRIFLWIILKETSLSKTIHLEFCSWCIVRPGQVIPLQLYDPAADIDAERRANFKVRARTLLARLHHSLL